MVRPVDPEKKDSQSHQQYQYNKGWIKQPPIFVGEQVITHHNERKENVTFSTRFDMIGSGTECMLNVQRNKDSTKLRLDIKYSDNPLTYIDYVFRAFRNQDETKFDILSSFPKNNTSKEMIETGAAVKTLVSFLGNETCSDETVRCYVIGDGSVPSCGILLSIITKWNIISIDPKTTCPKSIDPSANLRCVKDLAENVITPDNVRDNNDLKVLVSIHGHADLYGIVKTLRKAGHKIVVLSVPCCYVEKQMMGDLPVIKTFYPTIRARLGVSDHKKQRLVTKPRSNEIFIWKYD